MSPTDPTDPTDPAESTAPDAAAASDALLRVRGLRKSFGPNQVLQSIDLTVGRGQVLALIGPSGSGKTTILRCLNGLELADGGTIDVADEISLDFGSPPTKKRLAALRDRSAMVFQHYNLFPHKTVLENRY